MQGHDPRYTKGIWLFNSYEFYQCHDTLEELWLETTGEPKDFYKGLIQAAVALYHFSRGNARGAKTLYWSSVGLLEKYAPKYKNIDVQGFLDKMAECFKELLDAPEEDGITLMKEKIPQIVLI